MAKEDNELEELAPWLVIIFTVVGACLRIFLLDGKGMWLNETLSVWVSSMKVGDMLQWIARVDQHPPLYYLLLHFWLALKSDSTYFVRLLSVLFGTATIPVIYLIGKRISGLMVGVAAAIFFALSPFNIRFAQEARMYSLLTFNAAVAIYALVRLLTDARSSQPIGRQFKEYFQRWRTPGSAEPEPDAGFSYRDEVNNLPGWRSWINRRRWSSIKTIETDLSWVLFIVFSAATLLSHNSGVLFPLSTNIFVLALLLYQRSKPSDAPLSMRAPSLKNWLIAQVAIIILWSPWVVAFIKQVGRVFQESFLTAPGWYMVIQTAKSFLNEPTQTFTSQISVLISILYAVLLILGLVSFRKNISQFLFLAALFAIPFLGELVLSLIRPVFLDRTLIWTIIPLVILLAAGLAQLRYKVLIIVVLCLLGTINLFSAGDYYRFAQKEDWSNPAGFVAKWAQNGDLVLFNASMAQVPFDYYFKQYEDLYQIQVEKRGLPVDMFDSSVMLPKMTESDIPRLVSLLNGRRVVWLVYSRNENTDPLGLIPQTLAEHLQLVAQRDFNGVQVQLYTAP